MENLLNCKDFTKELKVGDKVYVREESPYGDSEDTYTVTEVNKDSVTVRDTDEVGYTFYTDGRVTSYYLYIKYAGEPGVLKTEYHKNAHECFITKLAKGESHYYREWLLDKEKSISRTDAMKLMEKVLKENNIKILENDIAMMDASDAAESIVYSLEKDNVIRWISGCQGSYEILSFSDIDEEVSNLLKTGGFTDSSPTVALKVWDKINIRKYKIASKETNTDDILYAQYDSSIDRIKVIVISRSIRGNVFYGVTDSFKCDFVN